MKQIETIEDQGEKQVEALKDLKPKEQTKSIKEVFPKVYESVEIKNEINKIKEYEKRSTETIWFIIQAKNELFDSKTFKTRSFGENIYNGKITINEANQEQDDLVVYFKF